MAGDIKDLFGRSNSILPKTSIGQLTGSATPIESSEYIEKYLEEKLRVLPTADFSTASNFAIYGSAEQYAIDAITGIYNTYPYDGSATEKIEWFNGANYYDLYLFEFLYPRTCGYAVFGPNGWGSQAAIVGDFGLPASPEYIQLKGGPHPDPEAATKSLAKQFPLPYDGTANVWDGITGIKRESNIVLDLSEGITVEFWMKKDGYVSSSLTTRYEVLFDTWNNETGTSTSDSYGRFALLMDGTSSLDDDALLMGFYSGSSGQQMSTGIKGNDVLDDNWHHVAVTIQSGSNYLETNSFLDGAHKQTNTYSSAPLLAEITGSLIANIGAARIPGFSQAQVAALTSGQKVDGYAAFNGSLDEFRFWKTARTPKEISRFWFTQIAGGTNTDNHKFSGSYAPAELGFYYKFNEGNTGDEQIDTRVLDYSGRISNGKWHGFISDGSRVAGPTASAMIEASASVAEFKDPIIYSSHPDVMVLSSSLIQKGQEWDVINNSALYHTLPEWITSDDRESQGETLKKLMQIIGVYCDKLQMQIKHLPSLMDKQYPYRELIQHYPNAPEYSLYGDKSGKTRKYKYFNKPSPFARNMLLDSGFIAPEIFSGVNELAQFASRDEVREFEDKLYNVKNSIYQNLYNNLTYIYKSKGTAKAFRNLIHCFGVDDDLVKINLYANDQTYKFDDSEYHSKTIKRKYINFATTDRAQSTIYQSASLAVPGAWGNLDPMSPSGSMTFEAEVIFPYKHPKNTNHWYRHDYLTGSIFGCHGADDSEPTDYAWPTDDPASFQVHALREEAESPNVRFMLTSSNGFFTTLTSSLFHDVYDNNRWTFAVRLGPGSTQVTGPTITGSLESEYLLEFYGVNVALEQEQNSFYLTASVDTDHAQGSFLSQSKRLYAGAHRENFTGSVVLHHTDIKLGSITAWADRLSDAEIMMHAVDPANTGRSDPYDSAYLFEDPDHDPSQDGFFIPKLKTQLLNWQFNDITGSSNGVETDNHYGGSAWNSSFEITDMASGSDDKWDVPQRYKTHYSGRGDWFLPNDTTVANLEFVYVANQNLPEVMSGDDTISILTTDDNYFTRDAVAINHYFAIEKSMAQAISKEMLDMMGSAAALNNIIGNPVNRYRQEYKTLEKVRELFFRSVSSEIDFNRFIEFYKWIDDALSAMLMELVPASANTSDGIKTVIESHILERNKYWTKFPTLEMKAEPIVGFVKGIKELTYDWKHGHPPPQPSNSDIQCLWWKERSEASVITSGDTAVDTARNTIRRVVTSDVTTNKIILTGEYTDPLNYPNAAFPNAAQFGLGQSGNTPANRQEYKGSTFALRRFSKPYKMDLQESREIRSGHNPARNNKGVDVLWSALRQSPFGNAASPIIQLDLDTPENDDPPSDNVGRDPLYAGYEPQPNCADETIPSELKKFKRHAHWLNVSSHIELDYDSSKARIVSPFSYYSQSADIATARPLSDSDIVDTVTAYTNLHGDSYGPNQEIPMQGPFSERHVGGRLYRHADINRAATDSSFSRLEGWGMSSYGEALFGSASPFFSAPSDAYPRGHYYRDETAKRPVNIKNILTTTGSQAHGNYDHLQQVIHTQVRTGDPALVKLHAKTGSDGITSLQAGTTGFITVSDTPDRPKLRYFMKALLSSSAALVPPFDSSQATASTNKYVMIERFSAPGGPDTAGDSGGGFGLAGIAARYSPNNNLNYRNLAVRQPLNALSKAYADRFGAFSGSTLSAAETTAVTASYHKVQRNTDYRHQLLGASSFYTDTFGWDKMETECVATYDNRFVQHPIPANDYGYAWITASAERAEGCSLLTTSSFLTASDNGSYVAKYHITQYGRVFGIATATAIEPGSWNTFTEFLPADFVGLNSHIYEPVTGSTNILGYETLTVVNTEGGTAAEDANYVNSNFNNLFMTDAGDDDIPMPGGDAGILNALLLHRNGPYGYPSWKQLRAGDHPVARYHKKHNVLSVGLRPTTKTFTHAGSQMKGVELHGSSFKNYYEAPVTIRHNPLVHRVDSVLPDGGQTLQPLTIRHTYANNLSMFANVGITNELDCAKTDRQVYQDIRDAYINSDMDTAVNPIKAFRTLTWTETIYPKEANTFLARTRQRTSYAESHIAIRETIHGQGRTFWKDELDSRLRDDDSFNSMGYRIHTSPNQGSATGSYFLPSGALSIWPLDTGQDEPQGGPLDTSKNAYGGIAPQGDQWGRRVGELYHDPIGTIYASLSLSDLNDLHTTDHFLAKTSGGEGGRYYKCPGTASVCFNHFGINGTTRDHALHGTNYNRHQYEPNHIMDWATADHAGRNPWFNSYEEYAEDLRSAAKEYTILPEFRVSDHIDHYVENGFDADNYKFLSLTGAPNSSSAEDYTQGYNEPFWKEYCHTDFMKYFGDIQNDHADIAQVSALSFKCSAVAKLLPYNGFYPVQRTIQLASLLSSSYGGYITGSMNAAFGDDSSHGGQYHAEQLQSLLQPFYAPGIMYNTLKSCIAVDYPVHTGSSAVIGEAGGAASFGGADNGDGTIATPESRRFIESDPSFRMPFEAIISPHAYLPVSQSARSNIVIGDRDDATAAKSGGKGRMWLTAPYYGSSSFFCQWQGQHQPQYDMAAHNFFAEVPNFFLASKTTTRFVSKKSAEFLPMASGSVYYMDLVLYRTPDYVAHEGPAYESTKYEDFDPPAVLTTRGWGYGPAYQAGSTTNAAFCNDPAWAPHAPPYFYGRSVARIKFSPHHHMLMQGADDDDGGPESFVFTLDDILAGAEIETEFLHETVQGTDHLMTEVSNYLVEGGGDHAAARNRMHVSSSVAMFGKTSQPSIEYDAKTGEPLTATENPQADLNVWVINSKFECPSLNFYGDQGGALDGDSSPPDVPAKPSMVGGALGAFDQSGSLQHRVRGLFNGYGTETSAGTGIYLGLRETFPNKGGYVVDTEGHSQAASGYHAVGSLIDVCGFQAQQRKIGRIANQKIISEAIVAIPFYDQGGERKFFSLGATPAQSQELWIAAMNGQRGPGKSIRAMADRIPRYVFPPHLDFNKNPAIEPFAMYVFEFTHKLSKQDLINIWQGIMPDISVTAKKKVAALTHATGENEFFNGKPIPEHTRWMVFKVKRRAKQNYFAMTADADDDALFKFDFKGSKNATPVHSYNWPYDYFSLIELAKLDIKVGLGDGAIPVLPMTKYPLDLSPDGFGIESTLNAGTLASLANANTPTVVEAKKWQAGGIGNIMAGVAAAMGTIDPTKMVIATGGPGSQQGIPPGLDPSKLGTDPGWAGGTAGGPLADQYAKELDKANQKYSKLGALWDTNKGAGSDDPNQEGNF